MRILVLDDQQVRHDFFRRAYNSLSDIVVQAYDYDSALLELSSTPNKFDLMFLDHDLSEDAYMCDPRYTYEKTGSDVAEFIVREFEPSLCLDLKIYCHSMNPIGRVNMVNILKKGKFHAIDCNFMLMQVT
jgi:hypothetical protein